MLSFGEPFIAAKFSQSYWEMGMGPCCIRMSARALEKATQEQLLHMRLKEREGKRGQVFENGSDTFTLSSFPHVWERDEKLICERNKHWMLHTSRLIGLNLDVFQTAPGAYGGLKPSGGRGNLRGVDGTGRGAIMMKES